jgi:glycosyltransferase involved in cell wall biosynthesis
MSKLIIIAGCLVIAYFLYPRTEIRKYAVVTMIRNEERHVATMLRSTPRESVFIVCDTGSTDQTIEIVNATLQGYPNRIAHHTWVNFGHNRNKCLSEARAFVAHYPTVEWIILIDGDHEMQYSALAPTHDQNMVFIGHPNTLGTQNHLPYIISRRALYECVYVLETHEVLVCPETMTRGVLPPEMVAFLHRQQVGNKFQRDKQLLLDALADETRDKRWDARRVFYLARTFEDMGDYANASLYYQRRASTGAQHDQEVFYSLYRTGVCALKLNKTLAHVEETFHRAIRAEVCRVEPYFYMAQMHRVANNFERCLVFATAGLHSPPCKTYQLFVEQWIHHYALLEEYALCMYYSGYHNASHHIYLQLNNLTNLPADVRQRIQNSVRQTIS